MLESQDTRSLELVSPWLGRGRALVTAGAVLGSLTGITVAVSIPLFGLDALIAVVGCALIGVWVGRRIGRATPVWTRLDLESDTIALHRRDGSVYRYPYDDVQLFRPIGISLIGLLAGHSVPSDLVLRGGAVQVFLQPISRGALYRHLEQHSELAIIHSVQGNLHVPAPPEEGQDTWSEHYAWVVRNSFRHAIRKYVRYLMLFGVLLAGALAFQVAALVQIGAGAASGQLIALILALGALAGAQLWAILAAVHQRRITQRALVEMRDHPAAATDHLHGRVEIQLVKHRPKEIPPLGKWASVLSIVLAVVPVVGFVFACIGLYHCWERKSVFNTLAWIGFVLSFVGSFCGIGLLIP